MSVLADAMEARAFAPAIPFGEALSAVHVPFDHLVGPGHESRVGRIAEIGGLCLVIGDTGHGKSALVSWALSMERGCLAVPVPVSVPHPEGATAGLVPSLVLDGMANALAPIDDAAATAAQTAADRLVAPSRFGGAVDLRGMKFAVGNLLAHHRRMTDREQIDAIHQAGQAITQGGLRPVLVLDDTDKWVGTEERVRAGRSFFDDAVSALVDLELPVVANAHPRYFTDHVPDRFDVHFRVPPVGAAGVTTILERRVTVATAGADSLGELFTPEAITLVGNFYERGTTSIRNVLRLANEAVIEAVEAGLDVVTVGAVEAAIAAD